MLGAFSDPLLQALNLAAVFINQRKDNEQGFI